MSFYLQFGISFSFVDFNAEEGKQLAFTDKTKLVWLETPTNPTLTIIDIERTAKIAHEKGALLVVDNTFASPYFQHVGIGEQAILERHDQELALLEQTTEHNTDVLSVTWIQRTVDLIQNIHGRGFESQQAQHEAQCQ